MSGQRPKNLGQQGGILESQQGDRGQHAPGRNPQQEDRSAREMTGGHERKGSQYESEIERNRQDKGFKKGTRNEDMGR